MRDGYNASPINQLPPVVWALTLPILIPELIFALGQVGLVGGQRAAGWRLDAFNQFGFAPEILRQMVDRWQWPPEHVLRFVTYPFVHLNFTHALFVAVFTLALGKMVAEVFRPWAVLAVFFTSAIVASLIYTLIGMDVWLIGGYPSAYGLIGAFTFVLWTRLGQVNENRYRAFTLIGFLMFIQLVFALLFGGRPTWIADVIGFGVGFGLSFVVSPGGWQAVVAKLRQR